MKDILTRDDLAPARRQFELACAASRKHDSSARAALIVYGRHGAQVSGCVRDHFPGFVKSKLRAHAKLVTHHSDRAFALRPPRVRMATMRKLARAVAARDGSGFYGPQA